MADIEYVDMDSTVTTYSTTYREVCSDNASVR